MKYVLRILYNSSLFFGLLFFSHIHAEQKHTPTIHPSKKTEHWIIIHGTFARSIPLVKWWKKEGSGHQTLVKALSSKKKKVLVHSFAWSSENNHPARQQAARDLISFLKSLGNSTHRTIHIVAHSHGGTVALLAAHMIAEQRIPLRIAELFNLGTPIHASWYPKASSVIDTIYQLFSYGDMVQPVITMFQRILPPAPNIYNLQVKKDYSSPWHETLRSDELIMQLPTLHTLIKEPGEYCLHLDTKTKPEPFFTITPDTTREKDLATDLAFTRQIMNLYADSRKISFYE